MPSSAKQNSASLLGREGIQALATDCVFVKCAAPQVHSILVIVAEELNDAPLYLSTHDICRMLKCTPPRHEAFRSALVNAGFRVSSTHANALGIKTDAPMSVIWDIMRCWIRDHPIKAHPPDTYGAASLPLSLAVGVGVMLRLSPNVQHAIDCAGDLVARDSDCGA